MQHGNRTKRPRPNSSLSAALVNDERRNPHPHGVSILVCGRQRRPILNIRRWSSLAACKAGTSVRRKGPFSLACVDESGRSIATSHTQVGREALEGRVGARRGYIQRQDGVVVAAVGRVRVRPGSRRFSFLELVIAQWLEGADGAFPTAYPAHCSLHRRTSHLLEHPLAMPAPGLS